LDSQLADRASHCLGRHILEDAEIGPVYCASDLEVAYRLFLSYHPDVAIVDLAFPGESLSG
jgi:chemotaxis response regulator CheB